MDSQIQGMWDAGAKSPSLFVDMNRSLAISLEDIKSALCKDVATHVTRMCLHEPADATYNLMVLHQKAGTVSPFKAHVSRRKFYLHFAGNFRVELLEADGERKSIECDFNETKLIMIPPGTFHRTLVGDDGAIFVEVLDGPFLGEEFDRTYLEP